MLGNIQMSNTTFSKATGDKPGLSAPDQIWQLYFIEAFLLGCFMISATSATIMMESPKSIASHLVVSPILRRVVIGAAMGLTAVVLIYCPWGKRSGAHMNPAFTLSFLRLGKIKPRDALGYMAGQFIGAVAGMRLAGSMFGSIVGTPSVRYIATTPGPDGIAVAWGGECLISFILVATVLVVNRYPSLVKRTGLFCGGLITLFVIFEAPLSGFSMNPARTFGSAIVGNIWTAWWIYFTAPVVGMLGAVEVHRLLTDDLSKLCLRLNHSVKHTTLHPCDCRNPTSPDTLAGPDFNRKVTT